MSVTKDKDGIRTLLLRRDTGQRGEQRPVGRNRDRFLMGRVFDGLRGCGWRSFSEPEILVRLFRDCSGTIVDEISALCSRKGLVSATWAGVDSNH
jgi:hypothetical protein